MQRRKSRARRRAPRFPLQRLLEQHGMSAAELSRRTKISRALLSNYMHGHCVPGWPQIHEIAEVMGLDLGDLQPPDILEETSNAC
jgi:transcriptional regulator with XRE-family HTH domain